MHDLCGAWSPRAIYLTSSVVFVRTVPLLTTYATFTRDATNLQPNPNFGCKVGTCDWTVSAGCNWR